MIANTIEPRNKNKITTLRQNARVKKDLIVQGDTKIERSLDVKQSTTFEGTLAVKKNVVFDEDLLVQGNALIHDDLNVFGRANMSSLDIMDELAVGSAFVAFNNATLANLDVTYGATLHSTLSVAQKSTFSGDVYIEDGHHLMVKNGALTVNGLLGVTGNSFLTGDTIITGDVYQQSGSNSGVDTGLFPVVVAPCPSGSLVAVANQQDNTIQIFGVDQQGKFASTQISQASTGSGPCALEWAPVWGFESGGFIVVANKNAHTLQVFSVDPSGIISTSPIDSQAITASSPSLAFYPAWDEASGGFVAVTDNDADTLTTFAVSTSGMFSSAINTKTTGASPTSVAFCPGGDFIAVANQDTHTVQIFGVDEDGILSTSEISHTVTGTQPVQVAWSPLWNENDGGFIAVISAGDKRIETFHVTSEGDISSVKSSYTLTGAAHSLAWAPHGLDVFGGIIAVADGDNGFIGLYSIDPLGNILPMGNSYYGYAGIESLQWSLSGNVVFFVSSSANIVGSYSPFICLLGARYGMHLNNHMDIAGSAFVKGNATVNGQLSVSDTTTLYKSLDVKESATIEGTLDVDQDLIVKRNALVINDFHSDGRGHFRNLEVQDEFVVATNFLSLRQATMDAVDVVNSATVHGTFNVDKKSTFSGDVCIANNKNLIVENGLARINGQLGVRGQVALTGDMFATGGIYLNNTTYSAVNLPGIPTSIDCLITGEFVATVHEDADLLVIHRLDDTGQLVEVVDSVATGSGPTSVAWLPFWYEVGGGYLAVANNTAHTVEVYSVTEAGQLALLGEQTIGGDKPHVAWFPLWGSEVGGVIAVIDNQADTISTLAVSSEGDVSTPISTITTGNGPSSLAFSYGGHFIAVTNNDSNTVQIFSVDVGGDFSLQHVSSQLTGDGPMQVAWSPTGDFIAVITENSQQLEIFAVDESGNLSAGIDIKDLGGTPSSMSWLSSWSNEFGGFLAVTNRSNASVDTFGIDTRGHISPRLNSESFFGDVHHVCWHPSQLFFVAATADPHRLYISSALASRIGREGVEFKQNTRIGGSCLIAGNATIGGNLSAGGPLDLTGTFSSGSWHDVRGAKQPVSIGTSQTNVLNLTFAHTVGITPPLNKGAIVKLKCFMAGTTTESVDSLNYYEGSLLVLPGNDLFSNCQLSVISESTHNMLGASITLTSDIMGTGTGASLTLGSSQLMTKQSVDLFYEVSSSNLISVF